MICEKSARCEKHVRYEKLARKKDAHKITQKLATHVSRFDYFLVQLNFIPHAQENPFISFITITSTMIWFQM